MDACRHELTLRADDLTASAVGVAERGNRVLGVVQVSADGGEAQLDKLFVDPIALRSGAGRALFLWAKAIARERNARVLVIESDPGAAPFYRKMGAVDDG